MNGVASVLTAAVFAPLGLALDPSPEEPRRGLGGGSAMWLVAACTLGSAERRSPTPRTTKTALQHHSPTSALNIIQTTTNVRTP